MNLLITLLFPFLFTQNIDFEIDTSEAQDAFTYLNKVRTNPAWYEKELSFDSKVCVAMPHLIWNDTLAHIAEQKAMDMATRSYFDHVDPDGYGINYHINKGGYSLNDRWLQNKEDNFFESLGYNYNHAAEGIKSLIIDEGEPSLGHRYHLLGHGHWFASLTDVGIAFVKPKNNQGPTYLVVIIAKHK